jgi:hypothetical protein
LRGIAAHIGEGQHRNRGLVGQGKGWSAFDRCHFRRVLSGGEPHSEDPHRTGNILEALLSHVLEGKVEMPGYVLLNTGRDANASGLGQTFEPSRHVDAVTEDVAIFDNHIAHVDTHSKFDALLACDPRIALGHALLPFGRTSQGIDDAGELDQETVPGSFDYAAMMFADLPLDYVRPDRP